MIRAHQKRRPLSGALWIILALVGLTPAQAALPDDGVSLVIEGLDTPYAQITYELVRRHGTPMAVIRKAFPEPFGHQQALALLPEDEFQRALARIGRAPIPTQRRPVAAPGLVYRLSHQHGGRAFEITLSDPDRDPHPNTLAMARLIREEVERHAGQVMFLDGLILAEEAGRLRIDAHPKAQVILEDQTVLGTTPLDPVSLPVGRYMVVLKALEGGAEGRYSVTVEAGRTTSLDVELK